MTSAGKTSFARAPRAQAREGGDARPDLLYDLTAAMKPLREALRPVGPSRLLDDPSAYEPTPVAARMDF